MRLAACLLALMACSTKPMTDPDHPEAAATVTITAGAGGDAARQWAQTLFRMYSRWATTHGYKVVIIDPTERDATSGRVAFTTTGADAFDVLKGESGVHRLVAFDEAAQRRYAAFANVSVVLGVDHLAPPVAIAWENQIRTYTLHPTPSVKDDRTGVEVENAQAVLDGDLDPFLRH